MTSQATREILSDLKNVESSEAGAQFAEISMHQYRSEAIPAIIELLKLTVGEAPSRLKTEEFWRWKHEANPFGRSYGLYTRAEGSNEIVGLRSLRRFVGPQGEEVLAARAVDTATHPGFQRRGIFSRLTMEAIQDLRSRGVHLIFNTPNAQSLEGYLKLGWRVVEKWPLYIKPLRPVRMLASVLQRNGTAGNGPVRFEEFFNRDILSWDHFINRYGNSVSEVISQVEAERERIGLRTPRTVDYMQWRYGQHPQVDYGFYAHERAGRLDGFAILRPNVRYGMKEIVLAEMFPGGRSDKASKKLLQNLFKSVKGDYMIAHFAEGAAAGRFYESAPTGHGLCDSRLERY